jgi:predicted  nucleic acid-binding Zn-ribbon protein
MKNLRFKNVWLLSRKGQTARHESLDFPKTAILGGNKRGKSCLIKSLYQAFGADPAIIDPKWKAANAEICVDFEVDGTPYTIVRKNNHYGVFDSNGSPILRTAHVVKDLGPKLAEVLGFGMKAIYGKGQDLVTPPPAFCFLPFYVDQDSSWQATWTGFANVTAVTDSRGKCAEYHSGKRPNAYYDALSDQQIAIRDKAVLDKELDVLKRAKSRFDQKRRSLAMDLQPEAFGDRVEAIVAECEEVQAKKDAIKSELADLVSERVIYTEQVRLSKIALDELDADYQYASSVPDEVICPTCGTTHNNDFVNRFSINSDADSCREIIAFGQDKLRTLTKKINDAQVRLNDVGKEANRLNSLLSEERGKIRLRDLLRGESERMLDESFSDEFSEIEGQIAAKDGDAADAESRMAKATDKDRNKAISETFQKFMTRFVHELDVHALSEKELKDIKGSIKATGSELPRAVLAYKYAFFHTMLEFSSSPLCPLVVDSPLQQEQDDENIQRILKFITKNTPDHCQLILGCVKLHDADFEGHVIEAKVRHKLLQEEAFEYVKARLDPLVNSMLA